MPELNLIEQYDLFITTKLIDPDFRMDYTLKIENSKGILNEIDNPLFQKIVEDINFYHRYILLKSKLEEVTSRVIINGIEPLVKGEEVR